MAPIQSLHDPSGQHHQLRIWPANTAGPAPLLLCLDGDWLHDDLELFCATTTKRPVHLASLGYGLEHAQTAARRAFDYTPLGPQRQRHDPRVEHWRCGGADAFTDFLQDDVLPRLRSRLNVAGPVALYGHSYAGLYCLYALLRRPALFDYYYAASPALWWYWPMMLNQAQSFSLQQPAFLLTMAGENEQWHAQPAIPGQPRRGGSLTLPLVTAFMDTISTQPLLHADLQQFSELGHGPMLQRSALHALHHFIQRSQSQHNSLSS